MKNNKKERIIMMALGITTATCLTLSGVLIDTKIQDKTLNNQLTKKLQHSKIIEERLNKELSIFSQEKKLVMEKIIKLSEENKNLKDKLSCPSEKVYFNENDITKKSNATEKVINNILKNTGLAGLGNYYVQAEKEYNINAIALIGITAQESSWGNSDRAKRTNNLSGYAVYSSDSNGASFSTKGESIIATAKLLYNDYLNKNGKYYQGKDLYIINETYCPDDNYHWSNSITTIGTDIEQKINNLI